jgi:hypothetical protein
MRDDLLLIPVGEQTGFGEGVLMRDGGVGDAAERQEERAEHTRAVFAGGAVQD